MKRRVALVLPAVVGCLLVSAGGCKTAADTGPGGGSGGAATCDQVRAHVERLYRGDAEAAGAVTPASIEEAVADNLAMVMTDCAAAPTRVAPCAGQARSVAELEDRCLIPLDDDGREGERFGGP